MTKPTVGRVEADTSEANVAEYLQQHPDFFERHVNVLAKLKLPHSRGASAVSLVERQVAVLRDKNGVLEQRLHELIEVGRGNDVLNIKIHQLACRLIRARTAEQVFEALESSLREEFGASDWILISTRPEFEAASQTTCHLRVVAPSAAELRMFETLFESGRPRCGQIRDSQRDWLFGQGTNEIGSAALVPLGSAVGHGILAIGSPDAERFHPTMSTDYLARIGELVSAALSAV